MACDDCLLLLLLLPEPGSPSEDLIGLYGAQITCCNSGAFNGSSCGDNGNVFRLCTS